MALAVDQAEELSERDRRDCKEAERVGWLWLNSSSSSVSNRDHPGLDAGYRLLLEARTGASPEPITEPDVKARFCQRPWPWPSAFS
jgi:hypothetical protein